MSTAEKNHHGKCCIFSSAEDYPPFLSEGSRHEGDTSTRRCRHTWYLKAMANWHERGHGWCARSLGACPVAPRRAGGIERLRGGFETRSDGIHGWTRERLSRGRSMDSGGVDNRPTFRPVAPQRPRTRRPSSAHHGTSAAGRQAAEGRKTHIQQVIAVLPAPPNLCPHREAFNIERFSARRFGPLGRAARRKTFNFEPLPPARARARQDILRSMFCARPSSARKESPQWPASLPKEGGLGWNGAVGCGGGGGAPSKRASKRKRSTLNAIHPACPAPRIQL